MRFYEEILAKKMFLFKSMTKLEDLTVIHVNRSGKGSQNWNTLQQAGNYPGNKTRLQVNRPGKRKQN